MQPIAQQDQVRRCAADIQNLFPILTGRYSSLILIAALTEHVGNALFVAQRTRTCSRETARTVVDRVKALAFAP
jgi:hypothetical protein